MAEFSDHLYRTVLHVDPYREYDDHIIGYVRVVFQRENFGSNTDGWYIQQKAEVRVNQFVFDKNKMEKFIHAAKDWLGLPISKLSSTYFLGTWQLGYGEAYKFDLDFQTYYSTPSKTDWFNVGIFIATEELTWQGYIHTDYTCLSSFVEGLAPTLSN